MEELIEQVAQLKNSLDTTEEIKTIKRLQTEIQKDHILYQLLLEYQQKPTDEKKQEIYQQKLFQEYKTGENEVNLLIFKINNTLNKIKDKKEL